MFNKILIANRGEIAVRAIRACRELGIRTVAIYEPEDADSLHVGMADEAVELKHPEPPEGVIVTRQSAYLWHYGIIAAGHSMGAEAIYPGYGYLSENPFFAEACERSSLVWIGPRSDILMYLSDKATARQLAVQTGLPVVPGSNGPVGNHEAIGIANEIGYPVMVKAARGGGGRGIRVARNEVDLLRALSQARNEAQSAFGSDQVYVEKQIPSPRHIEVQVLGDSYGHVIHLGERECSIQTPRHQKVIEESPANISPRLRRQICQAAVKLAEAIGYTNAGTVEFLVDGNGRFYFLEINTRIQVEHPVTEAVTGFDLVEAQIRIAAGEEFGSSWPGIIESHGHAIELRVTAQDVVGGFTPATGIIYTLELPKGKGIRIDTHLSPGFRVSSVYDPLLAKLIVHAGSRPLAIKLAERALRDMDIDGVTTMLPFLRAMMGYGPFRRREGINTAFLHECLRL